MRLLEPSRRATLRPFFQPERPGPLCGAHTLQTGHGACFVDRWPDPRAVLVRQVSDCQLRGDPAALAPDDLVGRVSGCFVDAPPAFAPLLREAFPDHQVWDRVILELPDAPRYDTPPGANVRRLEAGDAHHLWGVSPELSWIYDTFGGPDTLASTGLAWGAFVDGALASVASPAFVGERYEDLGVITEPAHRGHGLSPACAGRLADDVRARGRTPSWSTGTQNAPSQRVAVKLGFRLHRKDVLYVVGRPVPGAAQTDAPGD